MDLSQYLQNGEENQAEPEQQLSKEEYAALKKQQREEVWGEVDSKAQEVFQNGESLKGFLNFMAQCKPQPTCYSCMGRIQRSGRSRLLTGGKGNVKPCVRASMVIHLLRIRIMKRMERSGRDM